MSIVSSRSTRLIIVVLIGCLIGIGYVQYRFLVIGLRLEKVRFDREMATILSAIDEEFQEENQLTALVVAAISPSEQRFRVSNDTVQDAAAFFLESYLQQKLKSASIKTDIGFRLTDYSGKKTYLQSAGFVAEKEGNADFSLALQGFIPASCACKVSLRLQTPDLLAYFFGQLTGLLLPALGLLVLATLCIVWLVRLLRQLNKLDQVKNDFINNLTHELKTPVFSISLAARMLENQLSPEQAAKYLSLIQLENEKLKTHIEQVLNLASLEQGSAVVNLRLQEVQPMLAQIARVFGASLEARGGTFRFENEAPHAQASIDEAHFGNAIHNLLDNALKYSPGEIDIALRVHAKAGVLYVEVSDKGMGIPKAEQQRIFEKFQRISQGDLHTVKGFGLGLSYTREVVRLHHGKLSLSSEPGKGSTFTLEIPLKADTQPADL